MDLATFGTPSHLSRKGLGITQQLYEYLFAGTSGNSKLYSDNPVIAAIQGDAASKIKSVHISMLGDMERAANLMDSFIAPAPATSAARAVPAPRSQTLSPAAPANAMTNGAVDCSLLDGPSRTDFAVKYPDEFGRLVERCLVR